MAIGAADGVVELTKDDGLLAVVEDDCCDAPPVAPGENEVAFGLRAMSGLRCSKPSAGGQQDTMTRAVRGAR